MHAVRIDEAVGEQAVGTRPQRVANRPRNKVQNLIDRRERRRAMKRAEDKIGHKAVGIRLLSCRTAMRELPSACAVSLDACTSQSSRSARARFRCFRPPAWRSIAKHEAFATG